MFFSIIVMFGCANTRISFFIFIQSNKLQRHDNDPDANEGGSGNDGDDEEEYTGSHGTTKISSRSSSLKQQQSSAQPLIDLNDMYLRQNGFMAPPGWPQGVGYGPRFMVPNHPQYRHQPPAVFDGMNKGRTTDKNAHLMQTLPHMRCFCCGEVQHWEPTTSFANNPAQFFTTASANGGIPFASSQQPSMNPGFPGGTTMFIKAPPTGSSSNAAHGLPVHLPTSTSVIRPRFVNEFHPQPHLPHPTVPNTLPHPRGSFGLGLMGPNGRTACFASRHSFPVAAPLSIDPSSIQNMDWSVNPMYTMLNQHRMPYAPEAMPYSQSGRFRQHKDGDPEDIRYGPFSDGEGGRITKRPQRNLGVRRPSFPMSNTIMDGAPPIHHFGGSIIPPHYVTLSRATMEAASATENGGSKNTQIPKQLAEQINLGVGPFGQNYILHPGMLNQQMGNKHDKKYTSQPHLNMKNGVAFNLAEDKSSQVGRSSSCGASSSNKTRQQHEKPEVPKYKPILQVQSHKKGTILTTPSVQKSTNYIQANVPSSHVMRKDNNIMTRKGSSDEDYLFPDLPPPPDALLDPNTTSVRTISSSVNNKMGINKVSPRSSSGRSFLNHQTSFDFASSDSQMQNDGTQNSRSSSLDDLTLQECPPLTSLEQGRGDKEADIRSCAREGFYEKSNTLPINSSLSAPNGVVPSKRSRQIIPLNGSEEVQLAQMMSHISTSGI